MPPSGSRPFSIPSEIVRERRLEMEAVIAGGLGDVYGEIVPGKLLRRDHQRVQIRGQAPLDQRKVADVPEVQPQQLRGNRACLFFEISLVSIAGGDEQFLHAVN